MNIAGITHDVTDDLLNNARIGILQFFQIFSSKNAELSMIQANEMSLLKTCSTYDSKTLSYEIFFAVFLYFIQKLPTQCFWFLFVKTGSSCQHYKTNVLAVWTSTLQLAAQLTELSEWCLGFFSPLGLID